MKHFIFIALILSLALSCGFKVEPCSGQDGCGKWVWVEETEIGGWKSQGYRQYWFILHECCEPPESVWVRVKCPRTVYNNEPDTACWEWQERISLLEAKIRVLEQEINNLKLAQERR